MDLYRKGMGWRNGEIKVSLEKHKLCAAVCRAILDYQLILHCFFGNLVLIL